MSRLNGRSCTRHGQRESPDLSVLSADLQTELPCRCQHVRHCLFFSVTYIVAMGLMEVRGGTGWWQVYIRKNENQQRKGEKERQMDICHGTVQRMSGNFRGIFLIAAMIQPHCVHVSQFYHYYR